MKRIFFVLVTFGIAIGQDFPNSEENQFYEFAKHFLSCKFCENFENQNRIAAEKSLKLLTELNQVFDKDPSEGIPMELQINGIPTESLTNGDPNGIADQRNPNGIADQRNPNGIADQRNPNGIADQRDPNGIANQRDPNGIADQRDPNGISANHPFVFTFAFAVEDRRNFLPSGKCFEAVGAWKFETFGGRTGK